MSDDLWYEAPTGRQLVDTGMGIRVLPRATPPALERARRTWPEARADDFDREGKLFVDKATGTAYRRVPGDPQLGGAGREDVSTWFISHDDAGSGICYLQKADTPDSVVSSELGDVGGRRMTAQDALR